MDKEKINELPENVVNLTTLRIERGLSKFCTCPNKTFTIDSSNRMVTCSTCGSYVDPYDALIELALKPESLHRDIKRLLEQRKQIAQYKPHLVVIKMLEQSARDKNMMPVCPKCNQPFELHELNHWTNRKYIRIVE